MQKTRLGIPVGVFGAAMFFITLFGGYIGAIVMAGYILLFEENMWLKKSAVKAVTLLISFSLMVYLINLIPGAIGVINSIANIFGGNFSILVVSRIVSAIVDIIQIVEKILFIILGIKALRQRTIAIPVVDNIVARYEG